MRSSRRLVGLLLLCWLTDVAYFLVKNVSPDFKHYVQAIKAQKDKAKHLQIKKW